MMMQPHDFSKLHPMLRASFNDNTDVLFENKNESELPVYMAYFQGLMKYHRIEKKSQQTFFLFTANYERKLEKVVQMCNLRSAYIQTSVGAFNIRPFLDKWAGALTLAEKDYDFIETHFLKLVQIALAKGTIHPDSIPLFFREFIYEKHVEALPASALTVLAEEELKTPRSIKSCWLLLVNRPHKCRPSY